MDTLIGGIVPTCRRGLGLAAIVATTGCGDSVVETQALGDLSGVWELTTTEVSNTCGLPDGEGDRDRMILLSCGTTVSVIRGAGLWGTGSVTGDRLQFTGTESDGEDGCVSTRSSTGAVSGTGTLLEGSLSTQVTFDPATCGPRSACTLETSARLSLIAPYRTTCLGRDQFGSPLASPYVLPWPAGRSYATTNSYCIPTGGHREQQAYDFAIPVGDTVVAARAGVVRQVKQDSPDDGQGTDHNHVMVEHEDGTVGFYAHLKQNGALVQVGASVEAGQGIALAGHSGTPDVVHLHFGVYDGWPPTEGQDRAVNFRNAQGPLDCRGGLVNGATYTATN
jgi:murein DD-endopeptidase MepM/ murein hydrolase activator NlpD